MIHLLIMILITAFFMLGLICFIIFEIKKNENYSNETNNTLKDFHEEIRISNNEILKAIKDLKDKKK